MDFLLLGFVYRAAAAIAAFTALMIILTLFTPRTRWRVPLIGLFLIGTAVLLVAPAFAQTVVAAPAPPSTLLHIPQALWDEINLVIVGTLVALAGLIFKWIDAHSPLKNTQAEQVIRDAFTSLLDKGAQYGLTQLNSFETKVGDVDVKNAAVAAGANFVIAQGPELAKKMGYDIETADGRAAVIRSITLRVGTITGSAGESGFVVPKPTVMPTAVTLAGSNTAPASGAPPPSKND